MHQRPLRLPPMPGASSCTTTIVTKGASADGSVMVSHSNDNHFADQSIVYVPAKKWKKGSKRPVYVSAVAIGPVPEYNCKHTIRLVDKDRAPGYDYPDEEPSIPVGYIPQVEETYAYLDGNYGIVNEHGLMFGECTDGVFHTLPASPERMFYSSELSRVALERCKTAREAITLMGELIEKYGYYGTGETLPLADENEGWVMEMAPSPDGKGGLWVAQMVPDGEFWVAGNSFRIREIYTDQKAGQPVQMWGKSLFKKIEAAGERYPQDKSLPMDWLRSVSIGEYSHPYYSLRRVWRAFSLVAPSLQLSPWLNPEEGGASKDYPFSVKPDKPITLDALKRIHRDHYEGTEFDLTKGIAAGPFGNPNRYLGPGDPTGDVGTNTVPLRGAWERAISMFYIGYTFINQVRPGIPAPLNTVCWLALNTPAESVFVPLAVAPTPKGYEQCDLSRYAPEYAWWTYNLVGEYANLKYSYMIKDIAARAALHETEAERLVAAFTKGFKGRDSLPKNALNDFTKRLHKLAGEIRTDWIALFGELVFKYNQGYVNTPGHMARKVGYPKEWLDETNYAKGPTRY